MSDSFMQSRHSAPGTKTCRTRQPRMLTVCRTVDPTWRSEFLRAVLGGYSRAKTCPRRDDRPLQLADLAPQLTDLLLSLRVHPTAPVPLRPRPSGSTHAGSPGSSLAARRQLCSPPTPTGNRRRARAPPNRLGLYVLVVPDRHERAILPKVGSMRNTRDVQAQADGCRRQPRESLPDTRRTPRMLGAMWRV